MCSSNLSDIEEENKDEELNNIFTFNYFLVGSSINWKNEDKCCINHISVQINRFHL